MKLFRVSEEKAAPNWTFASDSLDQYEKEDAINVDQINLTDEADVNDETLCEECGKIEQCASGGNNYYYNSSWQKGHISHLKEYALACGMDISKFKSISIKKADSLQVEASNQAMGKTDGWLKMAQNGISQMYQTAYTIIEQSLDKFDKANNFNFQLPNPSYTITKVADEANGSGIDIDFTPFLQVANPATRSEFEATVNDAISQIGRQLNSMGIALTSQGGGIFQYRISGQEGDAVNSPMASDQAIVKTASIESEQTSDLQDVWKDPFNIEERADTSHLDKAEWEITSKALKIDDIPTMSGINAIRGGEDYNLNIEATLPTNQNSISNPLAIEQLAEADDMTVDNGMRLRQEAADREEAKKQATINWEQEKIDAMEHKDIVPEGHVFQTAPEVAHTGIGTKASQMANIDAKDIPELTQGEMLAQAQKDHKASIQRPKVDEERISDGKSAYRSISSDFSDSLANALGK